MNHYAVFAFDNYYPSGGWGDFIGAFDNLEDARTCAKACIESGITVPTSPPLLSFDVSEIVDLDTLEVVT